MGNKQPNSSSSSSTTTAANNQADQLPRKKRAFTPNARLHNTNIQPLINNDSPRGIPNHAFQDENNQHSNIFTQKQQNYQYQPQDHLNVAQSHQSSSNYSSRRKIFDSTSTIREKPRPLANPKRIQTLPSNDSSEQFSNLDQPDPRDQNHRSNKIFNNQKKNHTLNRVGGDSHADSDHFQQAFKQTNNSQFQQRRHSDNQIQTTNAIPSQFNSSTAFIKKMSGYSEQNKNKSTKKETEEISRTAEFIADYYLCSNLYSSSSASLIQQTRITFNQDTLQTPQRKKPHQQSQYQNQQSKQNHLIDSIAAADDDDDVSIYLKFLQDLESKSIEAVDFMSLPSLKAKQIPPRIGSIVNEKVSRKSSEEDFNRFKLAYENQLTASISNNRNNLEKDSHIKQQQFQRNYSENTIDSSQQNQLPPHFAYLSKMQMNVFENSSKQLSTSTCQLDSQQPKQSGKSHLRSDKNQHLPEQRIETLGNLNSEDLGLNGFSNYSSIAMTDSQGNIPAGDGGTSTNGPNQTRRLAGMFGFPSDQNEQQLQQQNEQSLSARQTGEFLANQMLQEEDILFIQQQHQLNESQDSNSQKQISNNNNNNNNKNNNNNNNPFVNPFEQVHQHYPRNKKKQEEESDPNQSLDQYRRQLLNDQQPNTSLAPNAIPLSNPKPKLNQDHPIIHAKNNSSQQQNLSQSHSERILPLQQNQFEHFQQQPSQQGQVILPRFSETNVESEIKLIPETNGRNKTSASHFIPNHQYQNTQSTQTSMHDIFRLGKQFVKYPTKPSQSLQQLNLAGMTVETRQSTAAELDTQPDANTNQNQLSPATDENKIQFDMGDQQILEREAEVKAINERINQQQHMHSSQKFLHSPLQQQQQSYNNTFSANKFTYRPITPTVPASPRGLGLPSGPASTSSLRGGGITAHFGQQREIAYSPSGMPARIAPNLINQNPHTKSTPQIISVDLTKLKLNSKSNKVQPNFPGNTNSNYQNPNEYHHHQQQQLQENVSQQYANSYMNASNHYTNQHFKKRNTQADSYAKMLFSERSLLSATPIILDTRHSNNHIYNNKDSTRNNNAHMLEQFDDTESLTEKQQSDKKQRYETQEDIEHVYRSIPARNSIPNSSNLNSNQANVSSQNPNPQDNLRFSQKSSSEPIEVKMDLLAFKRRSEANNNTAYQQAFNESQNIQQSTVIPIEIDITQFAQKKKKQKSNKINSNKKQTDLNDYSSQYYHSNTDRAPSQASSANGIHESEGESILKSVTRHLITLKGKIEKDQQYLDQNNLSYQTKITTNAIRATTTTASNPLAAQNVGVSQPMRSDSDATLIPNQLHDFNNEPNQSFFSTIPGNQTQFNNNESQLNLAAEFELPSNRAPLTPSQKSFGLYFKNNEAIQASDRLNKNSFNSSSNRRGDSNNSDAVEIRRQIGVKQNVTPSRLNPTTSEEMQNAPRTTANNKKQQNYDVQHRNQAQVQFPNSNSQYTWIHGIPNSKMKHQKVIEHDDPNDFFSQNPVEDYQNNDSAYEGDLIERNEYFQHEDSEDTGSSDDEQNPAQIKLDLKSFKRG